MSQNYRVATWIPTDSILPGEVIIAQTAAAAVQAADTDFGNSGNLPGAGPGGSGVITTGATPPAAPNVGDVWIDISNPAVPEMKMLRQGNNWIVMAKGQGLPVASSDGEVIVSTAAANFPWAAQVSIDSGRY